MIDIHQIFNYDKIVNFLYEDNDTVSKTLIGYYQEYLLWVKSKDSKKKIDQMMGEYTNKTEFYKYVQKYFKEHDNDLLDSYDKVMRKFGKLYKQFQEEKLKKINTARWI